MKALVPISKIRYLDFSRIDLNATLGLTIKSKNKIAFERY